MVSNFKKNLKKTKKGFTLVEIMTVVALIAILFVIFVPRLDFSTNKVREAGVQTDFRSYQLAFEQVQRQNSGTKTFMTADTPKNSEMAALIDSLNSYLDKKLQIPDAAFTDQETSANEITSAVVDLSVQDPWKENYKFVWDYANDAIYIFCAGPDKTMVGTDAAGLLSSQSETTNADNYSISVTYAVDGLSIKTTGFDNNINR